MIKILYILDTVEIGGLEVLNLDVCRNARRHGLNITLVITGRGQLKYYYKKTPVEQYYDIPRRLAFDPQLILKIRKIIRNTGIKIIHCHQPVSALHAYLASRGLGVRLVVSYHGFDYDYSSKVKLVQKYLLPRADANVFVSRTLRDYFYDKYHKYPNSHIIYNGIDVSRLKVRSYDLRAKFSLNKNTIILGTVGNFNGTGRDHLTICKALPGVIKKHPNTIFIFVGGRAKGNIARYRQCRAFCDSHNLNNNVRFMGLRGDSTSILKGLDYFIYSSRHDSFGMAVVEAMMVGTPVLVNRLMSLMEVLCRGRYSINYSSHNPGDLGRKISWAISHRCETKALARHGKTYFRARYSIERHINQLKNLYQQLSND